MGTLITTLDGSFLSLFWQLEQLQHYLEAIVAVLPTAPAAIPVAVKGAIVVTVAGHEEFLASLAAGGIRRRKSAMREDFQETGSESARKSAPTCDLGGLIAMGSRRQLQARRAEHRAALRGSLWLQSLADRSDQDTTCGLEPVVQ